MDSSRRYFDTAYINFLQVMDLERKLWKELKNIQDPIELWQTYEKLYTKREKLSD